MKTEQMNLPKIEKVENEVYSFMHLEFEIIKAIKLLKENPRDPVEGNVEKFSAHLSKTKVNGEVIYKNLDEIEESKKSFTMGTNIDWKYAREMDNNRVNIPLLFISFEDEDRGTVPMQIDGHHRLARKLIDSEEKFQAYVLTPEESRSLYLEPLKILEK